MKKHLILKDVVKTIRRFGVQGRTLEFKLTPIPHKAEPVSWVKEAINAIVLKGNEELEPNDLWALDEGPVVQLPDGPIRGNLISGWNSYLAFQGIPYAAPPIGNFRFKEAQAVQPWSDILNTKEDPKHCASYSYITKESVESEDCLYLNIYTPGINPKNNYSVMVFVHGGGFTTGSCEKDIYGPEFLVLEGGVVLVVVQYRLGPYGFLSTGDEVLPGNLGLKDQNYALQWVQKNIYLFGGDPKKVTLFGQSAGAASVGMHLISEKSKGLFRAAICQSGSALNQWTADPNPKEYAYQLASLVDSTFSRTLNSTLELKEVMLKASLEDISKAASTLQAQNMQVWPVIEPKNYKHAFINKPHFDLVGHVSQVPLMIGVNSEEALFFFDTVEKIQVMATLYDQNSSQLTPINFLAKPNASAAEIGQKIKSIYLNNDEKFEDNLDKVLKFFSDQNFVRGNMEHALLHSKSSSVYFYEFSYQGRVYTNVPKIPGAGIIPHAAELPFVFNFEAFDSDYSQNNVLTQQRMTKLWSNFAKYLNPTPKEESILQYIIWPTVSESNFTILNINQSLSLLKDFKHPSFSKWVQFYFENGVSPFVTF